MAELSVIMICNFERRCLKLQDLITLRCLTYSYQDLQLRTTALDFAKLDKSTLPDLFFGVYQDLQLRTTVLEVAELDKSALPNLDCIKICNCERR